MRGAITAALVAASGLLPMSPVTAGPALGAAAAFSGQGFDAALRESERSGRPLVVMFSATWCGPCRAMEEGSWTDASVERWVREHGTALHLDWDKDAEVFRRYSVQSLPLLVAFRDGKVVDRTLGYKDAGQLLRWLEGVGGASPASPVTMPAPAPTTVVVPAPSPVTASGGPGTHTTTVIAAPGGSPTPAAPAPGPRDDRPSPQAAPEVGAIVEQLRARHEALAPAIRGADKGAANKARVEFRASAARAFVKALGTGRDADAQRVADEAVRLDDSAWVRVAMVNKAVEAGKARAWMGAMLDRAEKMGADVSKPRAALEAAMYQPTRCGGVRFDR
jgi:thiol-disulfide isomerase/thioredoxin